MSADEKPFCRWCILYFSTAGYLMSKIKGSFNKDPMLSPKEDFFSTVIAPGIPVSDPTARDTFFKELEKEVSLSLIHI